MSLEQEKVSSSSSEGRKGGTKAQDGERAWSSSSGWHLCRRGERNCMEKALRWGWGGDMSQVFSPHCYEILEQFQEHKKKKLLKKSNIYGVVKYLNHCKYLICFFCIPSVKTHSGTVTGCLFCRTAEPSVHVFLFFPLSLTRSALWAAWKEFTINKECIVNAANKIVTQSVTLRAGAVIYESFVHLMITAPATVLRTCWMDSRKHLRCWTLQEGALWWKNFVPSLRQRMVTWNLTLFVSIWDPWPFFFSSS